MNNEKYSEQQLSLLESLGFKEYDPSNDLHWDHNFIFNSDDKVFIEEQPCRQRIYVVIGALEHGGDEFFEVYVLYNIGCDAIRMPHAWTELSGDWLTHLKMSLYGHGFIKDGQKVKKYTNEEQP